MFKEFEKPSAIFHLNVTGVPSDKNFLECKLVRGKHVKKKEWKEELLAMDLGLDSPENYKQSCSIVMEIEMPIHVKSRKRIGKFEGDGVHFINGNPKIRRTKDKIKYETDRPLRCVVANTPMVKRSVDPKKLKGEKVKVRELFCGFI